MNYGEIYQTFKNAGYEIIFNEFSHNCGYLINYDSESIFINGCQFQVYGYIDLSRWELTIPTIDDRLGPMITVELTISLEDIDEFTVGTRWWDEKE